jgi:hypothetical protein
MHQTASVMSVWHIMDHTLSDHGVISAIITDNGRGETIIKIEITDSIVCDHYVACCLLPHESL